MIQKNYVLDFWIELTHDRRVTWMLLVLAGVGVGTTFGVFGAGGSAFATPVLVLLGVPAPAALASPLPAMFPASLAGAHQYLRAGLLDRRSAWLAIAAGLPAVLAGAALSHLVGGDVLLALSGGLLLVVGLRMLVPTRPPIVSVANEAGAEARSDGTASETLAAPRTALVVVLVGAAAFLTGLLANGGGFLLVPIFVLVLGLSATRAAGTSMVAVGALIVPSLATHWYLGNIDWSVSLAFAIGLIPATIVGARLSPHLPDASSRRAFGAVLVVFAVWFLATRVA